MRVAGVRAQCVAIDTDPGIDDALALMLALRSPELEVELITTVAGNVPVLQGTQNARRLLTLIAPEIPPQVAMGAAAPLKRRLHTARNVHGSDGLGGMSRSRTPSGAPRFPIGEPKAERNGAGHLVKLARERGRALTVIALGPLTNIATAIRRDAGAMRGIRRLVIMGGVVRGPGNVTPCAEFNIFVDPDAAGAVIASGIPITLVPLDATRQVRLTRDFLRHRLGASRRPFALALRALTRDLLSTGVGPEGFPMHDPLAVASVILPGLLRTESLPLKVETRGVATLGMTAADFRERSGTESGWHRVDVATGVDARAALDLIGERVLQAGTAPRASGRPAPRVVVVGSANTDFIVHAPKLPVAGETVLGRPLLTAYGGKGANQAVAAARAGARVHFIARTGDDDAGRRYLAHLQDLGIAVSGGVESGTPSGVALISVDGSGQNQISVAPGANERLRPSLLPSSAELRRTSLLVTQLETPLPTVEEALKRGREAGATTLLNAAPAQPLPERFASLVDILVANEGEALLLAGCSGDDEVGSAMHTLASLGYPTVVVTLGPRGIAYRSGGESGHLDGVKVEVQDATGSGDTFVGYLASGLARGLELPDALEEANAAAALSVTRAGAQPAIPTRRQVERFRRTAGSGGSKAGNDAFPGNDSL